MGKKHKSKKHHKKGTDVAEGKDIFILKCRSRHNFYADQRATQYKHDRMMTKSSPFPSEKPVRSEKAEKVEKPIKLVLKVGSNQEKVTAKPDSRSSTPSRPSLNPDKTKSKDHSSKKKKKKRSSSKERKKPKFDPGSSVSFKYLLV